MKDIETKIESEEGKIKENKDEINFENNKEIIEDTKEEDKIKNENIHLIPQEKIEEQKVEKEDEK